MNKRTCRKYSDEFKDEAVKLLKDQGYKTTEVPREFIEGLRKDRNQFEKEMKLNLLRNIDQS